VTGATFAIGSVGEEPPLLPEIALKSDEPVSMSLTEVNPDEEPLPSPDGPDAGPEEAAGGALVPGDGADEPKDVLDTIMGADEDAAVDCS
jgi:hypothetical protein